MTDPSNTLRKRAWEAGRDAATAGKAETANRRQQGTIYFDDWLDGFESVRWSACTPRKLDAEVVARVQEAMHISKGHWDHCVASGFVPADMSCTLRLSDVQAMLEALT